MQRYILLVFFCAAALSGQMKKILVVNGDPKVVAELATASPLARVVAVAKKDVGREIVDADGYIGDISPDEVRAGKKLKWVQIMSAGAEKVLFLSGGNDLRDSGIVLTNNRIVQGPEIADHAFAMLLYSTRGLGKFVSAKQSQTWQPRPYPGIELAGKTAVIVGVGGVGSQIALRAWAFGMKVIGVDPQDLPFSPFVMRMVKPDQLDEVLPEADVVFISAPHTKESNKMMGARQFELMKKDSYFVAVSRGGVYDMGGLVKALDSRKLAGAGVDVMDPEPLPKGHPLWGFENVVITPHIAGRSDQDNGRMVSTIKENVKRFCEGKPLINVVDKARGF